MRPLVIAALLAGCAGAPTSTPPKSAPPPEAAPILAAQVTAPPAAPTPESKSQPRRVALHFELGGRKFPSPLVHGAISGVPVWMLVDTGANSHIIASWVARRAGMRTRALGEVGIDHTGHRVLTYSVEHAKAVIDEWGPLVDSPMLVTDVPQMIERLGIGAFISPQWLARQGDGVVLDFPAREMRTAPWKEAARELSQHDGPNLVPSGARLCRDESSVIQGLTFVLPSNIDGHAVDLLLDTGAHRTDLLSTSQVAKLLVGRAKPSREQMYAASGPVRSSLVRTAQVRIGDLVLTEDIDLVTGTADPACPRDGVVSMDALESCTLLVGHEGVMGRCSP